MITGSWTARTVLELTRSLVTRVLVGGIQKATLSRKLKISDLPLTAATQRKPLFTNTSNMYTYWDTSFYRVSLFPFCSVLSKGRTGVKIKSVLRIRNKEKSLKRKIRNKRTYIYSTEIWIWGCVLGRKKMYIPLGHVRKSPKIIFAQCIFCRKPQVGVGRRGKGCWSLYQYLGIVVQNPHPVFILGFFCLWGQKS